MPNWGAFHVCSARLVGPHARQSCWRQWPGRCVELFRDHGYCHIKQGPFECRGVEVLIGRLVAPCSAIELRPRARSRC